MPTTDGDPEDDTLFAQPEDAPGPAPAPPPGVPLPGPHEHAVHYAGAVPAHHAGHRWEPDEVKILPKADANRAAADGPHHRVIGDPAHWHAMRERRTRP